MMKTSLERSISNAIKLTLALGLIALVWALAFFLVQQADLTRIESTTDLAAILFGASSIALFLLSMIVAFVSAFGWQSIVRAVRETARETVSDLNETSLTELKGRQLIFQGHLLGDLSIDQDTLEVTNRKRLAEAIDYCQQGYNLSGKIGGPAEYLALNNLVYYSAIAGERFRGDFLLNGARRLMTAGQEHNSLMLQLTACLVILQYGIDREEKRKAYEILSEIRASKHVPASDRAEAAKYLERIPEP